MEIGFPIILADQAICFAHCLYRKGGANMKFMGKRTKREIYLEHSLTLEWQVTDFKNSRTDDRNITSSLFREE